MQLLHAESIYSKLCVLTESIYSKLCVLTESIYSKLCVLTESRQAIVEVTAARRGL